MKCPYCSYPLRSTDIVCPACAQPLPEYLDGEDGSRAFWDRRSIRVLLFILCAILAVFVIGYAAYKLYYWVEDYRIDRLYTRGERTPVVSEITLDDGRAAHAISFFADDGSQIYIPEINRSTVVAGSVARVEIADSDWFPSGVTDEIESAIVTLSPVLIEEDGARTQLPTIEFTVEPPVSPINVISPASDELTVFTAVYPLEVRVIPGSTVLVNGEDVTDVVDRSGLLSVNVNVYAISENIITILVRTPNHLEARKDVVIRRDELEIPVELDSSVQTESDTRKMLVSGQCEPGAMIEVDSSYVEDSLYINMETGEFEFLTDFTLIGENTVLFRAVMDGKQDSEIHFTVNYTPTLAEYSAAAWPLLDNYDQLMRLYAQWQGHIFLCEGKVLEVFYENEQQYVVMDVNNGGGKLAVLINESNLGSPEVGGWYSAYAHVDAQTPGRYMYNAAYYPLLTTLYMSEN